MNRLKQIEERIVFLTKQRSLTNSEIDKAEIDRKLENLGKEKVAIQIANNNIKETSSKKSATIVGNSNISKSILINSKEPDKAEEKTVNGVIPPVEKEELNKEEIPTNNKKNFYKNNNLQKKEEKEDNNDVK